MKKLVVILFSFLFGADINAQNSNENPYPQKDKKIRFAGMAGTNIYLNKKYAIKAGEFTKDGYPTGVTYPFFGNSEKSRSLQYKNALGNIAVLLPQIELCMLYRQRHIYGIGGVYVEVGGPHGKYVSGPFYENFMSMREIMSFLQYKYKPFFNSKYSFVKNIYTGAMVTYEYKRMDFYSRSNSGAPSSNGSYNEKNHLWLLQLNAGWLSLGKVMLDEGLQMNLLGITSADYYYHYYYFNWSLSEEYEISDRYSKIFYLENFLYTASLKIGLRF